MVKAEALNRQHAARMRREGRAMARMTSHPNLVTVYDAGDEAGRPYIVEEYVAGGTLAEMLDRDRGRPLEVEQTVEIAAGLCAGLEHVHRHGMVHRDLKPQNVWLSATGIPKLGDFGLQVALRKASDAPAATTVTTDGLMVGTPLYMAPEQALARPVGPPADLYSLGVVLYEMTTGRVPFCGPEAAAIIAHQLLTAPTSPRRSNPKIPRRLNTLILALLAKDPVDRPEHAGAVRSVLEAVGGADVRRLLAQRIKAERLQQPGPRLREWPGQDMHAFVTL